VSRRCRRRWSGCGADTEASRQPLEMKATRVPLFAFPDVVLHAEESVVKRHPQFQAAKGGDIIAAGILVAEFVRQQTTAAIHTMLAGHEAELVPIHALESEGVNQIPVAMARHLGRQLSVPINTSIVQSNSVGHTGASGFHRLANQALFDGHVTPGQRYLIVDDFVGQGGTLANLIGFMTSQGGEVLGATVLTGKQYSAKLAPDESSILALRHKHGGLLENWWHEYFGFGFDCLTRSEARYLEKSADADTIRDRIAATRLEGGN